MIFIYYFKYGQHEHSWYFSDRLSQLRGPYGTREEAVAAFEAYRERLELERWGV